MTECPTDGVCAFCALAFSTLLSSQGAGAHRRRALTLLQGNRLTLPGKVPFVNSVRQNFANSWTCLASRVASAADLRAQREALARRTSLVAPRDLALSRPSPRGKKNSRGAPRLRQIKHGNSSLILARQDVIKRVRTVVAWPGRRTSGESAASAAVG